MKNSNFEFGIQNKFLEMIQINSYKIYMLQILGRLYIAIQWGYYKQDIRDITVKWSEDIRVEI